MQGVLVFGIGRGFDIGLRSKHMSALTSNLPCNWDTALRNSCDPRFCILLSFISPIPSLRCGSQSNFLIGGGALVSTWKIGFQNKTFPRNRDEAGSSRH